MSDKESKDGGNAGILEKLRCEFSGQAERIEAIEDLAGEKVDGDLPQDYWSYNDAELETELWSRMPDLDRALTDSVRAVDIVPSLPLPAGPGLPGKIKGGLKSFLLKLALPIVRVSLEKQDRLNRTALDAQERLNRQWKHMHFIEFLTIKQLRRRLLRLEYENRELKSRLTELETGGSGTIEAADHD